MTPRKPLLSLALALLLAACSKPPAVPVNEDTTVLAVSQAIRANRLTGLADECLAYRFDATTLKDAYEVEVRENHKYAKCGGDPAVSPRLFSVRISRTDGSMTTDQGSPTGEFHPLKR
ncbi:MAG: hypothetical protein ABI693_14405 [Bryobacteraceae bacterium]